MSSKATQCDLVLEFMAANGSITPVEALDELGCMRLASRISDLKRMGHSIRKEMVEKKNRFGETVRFARYSIAEHPFQQE